MQGSDTADMRFDGCTDFERCSKQRSCTSSFKLPAKSICKRFSEAVEGKEREVDVG